MAIPGCCPHCWAPAERRCLSAQRRGCCAHGRRQSLGQPGAHSGPGKGGLSLSPNTDAAAVHLMCRCLTKRWTRSCRAKPSMVATWKTSGFRLVPPLIRHIFSCIHMDALCKPWKGSICTSPWREGLPRRWGCDPCSCPGPRLPPPHRPCLLLCCSSLEAHCKMWVSACCSMKGQLFLHLQQQPLAGLCSTSGAYAEEMPPP